MKTFKQKSLTTEVAGATAIRNPWGGESVTSGLTPRGLATLLQQAAEGDHAAYLSLAEGMEERDPHYSSVLRTRKLAVSSLPVNVLSGDDSKPAQALADEVRLLVESPQFGDLVDGLLDALGKGYAVCEIMWDRSDPSRWWPNRYLWRDPRYFVCDRDHPNVVRLIDEANPAQGIELPPYKFAVHVPKLKSGIMLRGGLARLVAFSYICKAYAVKDWLGFLEIYGIPLRIGRYGASANKEDKDILKKAVANIGTDAAAILPENMQIEFEQITQAAGASEVFARLVEWIDRQVSKAVLGQTATRLWRNKDGSHIRLADILAHIAKRYGALPVLDKAFDSYSYAALNQRDQSDSAFLSRLAEDINAKFKPAGGRFVIAKADGKTTGGVVLPEATLKPKDCHKWKMATIAREVYKSAVAFYSSYQEGEPSEVRIGEGSPELTLRATYQDKETAQQAARGALLRSQNSQFRLELSLAHGRPDIFAGQLLSVEGLRPGANGNWVAEIIKHKMDSSGFTTTISALKPE